MGRLVFGAGSESLVVAQSAILARWFKGRELALSFGLTLAIARLGTLFSFNTEELIAARLGWQAALWAAAGLCALSLLANLAYWLMDRHAEKVLGLEEAGAGDKIVLADIRKFGASYWFVVAMCVTWYSAIFPFTALSTDFFHDKWGLPLTAGTGGSFLEGVFVNLLNMFSTAPGTSSIIIFASMCLAPVRRRPGGPHRPPRQPDDPGRAAHDPLLPAARLHDDPAALADVPARRLLRARAGGDVAVGAAHRREEPRRHGLRPDDHDPEHRPRPVPAG